MSVFNLLVPLGSPSGRPLLERPFLDRTIPHTVAPATSPPPFASCPLPPQETDLVLGLIQRCRCCRFLSCNFGGKLVVLPFVVRGRSRRAGDAEGTEQNARKADVNARRTGKAGVGVAHLNGAGVPSVSARGGR